MALNIRPSDGSHLTRNDRVELDSDVVQAAKESAQSGTAQTVSFPTEKEARSALAKLRTRVNADGQGLRATVYQEDTGEWALEFKVASAKRVMNRSTE